MVLLVFLTFRPYLEKITRMKAAVTSKGQVTIPKKLRDQFGIVSGSKVIFVATEDGIRLRKAVNLKRQASTFGCLKAELEGKSVPALLDELRGPVELPKSASRKKTA